MVVPIKTYAKEEELRLIKDASRDVLVSWADFVNGKNDDFMLKVQKLAETIIFFDANSSN